MKRNIFNNFLILLLTLTCAYKTISQNPFDIKKRVVLNNNFMNHIRPGDIVIWENWFAMVENGVTKDFLDNNTDLINLYNLNVWDKGREIIYSVYKKR